MGIYNGPSIYNQGGGGSGGGAYSDGGALVDGDFIKVENNTISTYDNTAHSDINYYFEVSENEIINAVIELTTTVNATVHVYIVQNGLYIPLGNIGGNTVNAGDQYNVNITGDSFAIEQVTGGGNTPEYAYINGSIYGIVEHVGLLWLTSNYVFESQSFYLYEEVKNININGWRLPYEQELIDLRDSLSPNPGKHIKSTTSWNANNGDNSSGLDLKADGVLDPGSGNILQSGNTGVFWGRKSSVNDTLVYASCSKNNDDFLISGGVNQLAQNVRLVYDL